MPKTYQALPTISLKSNCSYFHPVEPPEVAHWEDPAINVMVDFKYIKASTIGADESIDTALLGVRNCSYHVLLVVNKEQKILGLISAEDLLGEKPLKVIQERRLPRADIQVQMVMTPQSEILAIDFESLRHAKVAHVVATMHVRKQHYALAVKIDAVTTSQSVRGLFSAAQISKQLGRDVTNDLSAAGSIAELQHDLHLHD